MSSKATPPFSARLRFAARALLLPKSIGWERLSETSTGPNEPAHPAEALRCFDQELRASDATEVIQACVEILRALGKAQARREIAPLSAPQLAQLRLGAKVAPVEMARALESAFLFGPMEILQQQLLLCSGRNAIAQGELACEALAICATLPGQDLLLGSYGLHHALASWQRQGPLGIQGIQALCESPITHQQAREIDAPDFADLIDMLRHLPFNAVRIKGGEDGFWSPAQAPLLEGLYESLCALPLPWSQPQPAELALSLARQHDWAAFPKLLGQRPEASAWMWLKASMRPMAYDDRITQEQERFLSRLLALEEARNLGDAALSASRPPALIARL